MTDPTRSEAREEEICTGTNVLGTTLAAKVDHVAQIAAFSVSSYDIHGPRRSAGVHGGSAVGVVVERSAAERGRRL